MTHYDLFAGIGGFSLALEEVFNEAKIKHIFCEWEHFPSAVLKKHWPNGIFYGDIADLVADTNSQRHKGSVAEPEAERRSNLCGGAGRDENETLTILTGGFPCQPFSHAGRRKGTADDRYQWPTMFRVIQNVKPDWVIAENVRGLVTWNDGMVLEQVCTDLESEGYEVQPFIIPACAVNAPHRRDRIWIIAHTEDKRNRAGFREIQGEDGEVPKRNDNAEPGYSDWRRDWRKVAIATCNARMDDGLPREVDGISYSFAKWRNESIKAYGNAIVPQVAMEIFRAIKRTINVN
ncbi:DNA (cytosine-5-)-methyltransferase [Candidatus Saccharibacteria bacterium]|nr:DNA (cytosine-5-)-methyltransferase [Candidatus Saccharibacteria bacterium]